MAYQLNPHMIMHLFDDNKVAVQLVVRALCKASGLNLTAQTVSDGMRYTYTMRAKQLLRELVLAATCEKVE